MWNVLPKLGLLKILLIGFSAMFLAVLMLLFGRNQELAITWANYQQGLEVATPVTIVFGAMVYIAGKWLWKIFWKIPYLGEILNRSVCPDLNGVWSGHIESNFTDAHGGRIRKDVELDIKADFFGFSICLKSLDGYQSSKVTQSEIYKDPRTGAFYVSYIYEGSVPLPESSDDRLFDGAAKIEVKFENGVMHLLGTYWTNRAWQRNQNTAGIIRLAR